MKHQYRWPLSKKQEGRLIREAEKVLPSAWSLARSIFDHPELAFQEKHASGELTRFLADAGFKVTLGVGGLATAFSADFDGARQKPRLGFLAEMDALPGLGHACGHHLIAASSAGAAAALARALDPLPGSISVIGTPAEEGGGGKLILADAGVFKKLDAALIAHPDKRTSVFKRSLGVVEVRLEFTGRAAHAAAEPEAGINALDAVIQTMNAVALLRQQLPDKTRVHGIITEGGVAPNIIPQRAAAVFLARDLTVADTISLAHKIIDCAKGAAKSTGATLKHHMSKNHLYAPYVPNRPLGLAFAAAMDKVGLSDAGEPEDQGMGSTDVGNAGLEVPILHPLILVPGVKSGVHTPEFAKAAGGAPGRKMLGQAIAALALCGAAYLSDRELRKDVEHDHRDMARSQLGPRTKGGGRRA